MEHWGPDELEERVREQLAVLMDLDTAAEAEKVRRAVVGLAQVVERLDSRVPRQWAVRRLYGYVDWRSHDAVCRERRWLSSEQAAIDRALLSVLDQSRHGRSVGEVTRARAGMERLRQRIDQLESGAEQAAALHCLWDYTDTASTAALERAELVEQERLQQYRRAVEQPAVEQVRERPGITHPTIEIEMDL
jgi:hypothetical protein